MNVQKAFKVEVSQEDGLKVTMYLQGTDFISACKQRVHTFNTTTNAIKQINVFTQPDNTLIGVYDAKRLTNQIIYEDIKYAIAAGINILLGGKKLQVAKPQPPLPAGYIPQPYNILLEIV